MSVTSVVFGVVGGLGLFLFGMSLMSDGIKAIAGSRLKHFLAAVTRRRVVAVLLGMLVTMLVQSSSATTVMTVGFVNAGLLTLRQALSVVLGANIGTTVTAWLVAVFGFGRFSITASAAPIVGIGFFLSALSRNPRTRNIGMVLLGFGLLFIGVSFLQETFSPIEKSPEAQRILTALSRNPLLAVLAGTLLTVLMQSSSASIMVIQVLAQTGAFGTDWPTVLNLTIPFILGDNIGTTITAQLAALRTSRNAKRAAMGHTVFNIVGVVYVLPIVWTGVFGPFISRITPWELSGQTIMADMAAANTLIKLVNTFIFLPFIGLLEAMAVRLVPFRPHETEERPVTLERHLLRTPVIAFQQVTRELHRMATLARQATLRAIASLIDDDGEQLPSVRKMEEKTDEFQYEITAYLSRLAQQALPQELSDEIPVLLHTVNDLERIGDLAVNIVEVTERKLGQKIVFSESAMEEARQIRADLEAMFKHIRTALEKGDRKAALAALEIEGRLNLRQVELRKNHVRRMGENECSPEAGLIFIDLVDNVEKIGDHLTNIAQSVIGGLQWDHHESKMAPNQQTQAQQEDDL